MSTKLIRSTLLGLLILVVVLISKVSKAETLLVEESINQENALKEKELKESYISKDIKMHVDHQSYLYDLCKERDLDYIKILALVRHESGFNPNNNNGTTYGYMQIHKMRHDKLSKELKTENKPLDPYVNLNWGTKILSDLYRTFEKEGYEGDKLDKAVWSSYNKGEYGFRRTGEAKEFIDRNYNHIKWVESKLKIK